MSTPLEIENLRPVFRRIMRTHQLRSEDVAENRVRKHIFNTGNFQCDVCGRTWESKFSWVTFDLKRLEIVKRWKMLCSQCHGECYPKFEVGELEKMFEKAVIIYLRPQADPNVDSGFRRRRNFTRPHLPELCEKCGYGTTQCWRIFYNH